MQKMQVVDPAKVSQIVNKSNFDNLLNGEIKVSDPISSLDGLSTEILPIDISRLQQVRHVKVAAGTKVPKHRHEGPIFRFITKGSATVNGVLYSEGDWMIIPASHDYEIETAKGYEALWICINCNKA